jgi:hypothetical protein
MPIAVLNEIFSGKPYIGAVPKPDLSITGNVQKSLHDPVPIKETLLKRKGFPQRSF